MSTSSNPTPISLFLVVLFVQGARQCSRPIAPCHARTAGETCPRTTTSETANRPPGLRTRNASSSTFFLSGREVDHAVGDDHIDGVVGERDRLDVTLEEFDVGDARLCADSHEPDRAFHPSCRARRPFRTGRHGERITARRCPRLSRGRERSGLRADRSARWDCRTPATRPRPPSAGRRSDPSYKGCRLWGLQSNSMTARNMSAPPDFTAAAISPYFF